ncbi:phasin family protein [Azospirillum argentinense]|uniref:Phasin domain-containing protein n=1 Tax=Azospirillum argentinense TaxID=2970906 RepID=A0A5B0KPW8_9PROT|nr:phasin family protein [Azospirillum argentinense]KAA1053793.1 hypothetical protein FH063_002375 [Azospirillum argentinense]
MRGIASMRTLEEARNSQAGAFIRLWAWSQPTAGSRLAPVGTMRFQFDQLQDLDERSAAAASHYETGASPALPYRPEQDRCGPAGELVAQVGAVGAGRVQDLETVMDFQRKNLEAAGHAAETVGAAVRTIATRNNEIMAQAIEAAPERVRALMGVTTFEDAITKQVEAVKGSFERTVANTQEMTTIAAKAHSEAAGILTARVRAGMHEVAALAKAATK